MSPDPREEQVPFSPPSDSEPRARDLDPREREVAIQRDAVQSDAAFDRDDVHLLPDDAATELRPRWADIQASFVDDPRRAVEQADTLVADAVKRLTEAFARTRADMEQEWDRGEEVSTEELRLALQRYRTFFDRLLRI